MAEPITEQQEEPIKQEQEQKADELDEWDKQIDQDPVVPVDVPVADDPLDVPTPKKAEQVD